MTAHLFVVFEIRRFLWVFKKISFFKFEFELISDVFDVLLKFFNQLIYFTEFYGYSNFE